MTAIPGDILEDAPVDAGKPLIRPGPIGPPVPVDPPEPDPDPVDPVDPADPVDAPKVVGGGLHL
jgi:hypothetical protein